MSKKPGSIHYLHPVRGLHIRHTKRRENEEGHQYNNDSSEYRVSDHRQPPVVQVAKEQGQGEQEYSKTRGISE